MPGYPAPDMMQQSMQQAMPPISNEEITAYLHARAQAKGMRDFMTADSIRNQLQMRGISITDRTRTWQSTDGRTGNTIGPDFFTQAASAGGMGGMMGAAPVTAPPVTGAGGETPSGDWINSMLMQRETARMNRDYGQADALREQMRQQGVQVDDRTKVWTAADGRTGMRPNADGSFTQNPHVQNQMGGGMGGGGMGGGGMGGGGMGGGMGGMGMFPGMMPGMMPPWM